MTLIVLADVAAAVLVLGLLGVALLVVRRRVLSRRGGTFECSLRLREGAHGKGWVLGIGRYAGDALEGYRVFSYSMRPRRALPRQGLHLVERREPTGIETFALLAGAVVVRLVDGDPGRDGASNRGVELAMSPESLTGFLSWVESAPPGVPRR